MLYLNGLHQRFHQSIMTAIFIQLGRSQNKKQVR